MWMAALTESGNTKTKIGENIVLTVWPRQERPGQMRAKLSYLANVKEAGLPAEAEPDVEQWWRYFRLYKLYPHHEVLFKCSDNINLTYAHAGRKSIFVRDTTDTIIPPGEVEILRSVAHKRLSSKDTRRYLNYFHPVLVRNEKIEADQMSKRFALQSIFLPFLQADTLVQMLPSMGNIRIEYAAGRFPELKMYGYDEQSGQPDSLLAVAKYNGDVIFSQMKKGLPTGVNSHYNADGTYIHTNGTSVEGIPQGIISNYKLNYFYEGGLKDSSKEGYGTAYYPDGSFYAGSWSRNRRDGNGTLTSRDGYTWEGSFVANKPFEGSGTLQLNDGTIVTCNLQAGVITGYVTIIFADGSHFQGDIADCGKQISINLKN